jgi:hypothetical protein
VNLEVNKMKKLPIIFIVLLFALPGLAATYYVSPTGSNTSPYDTWAKAANLPSTALTAGNSDTGGDGPHIMYVAPGTYSGQMNIADNDWAAATIIGTAAHGSIAPADKGQVIISHTAEALIVASAVTGLTVNSLSMTGTTSGRAVEVAGANTTLNGIYIYDVTATGLLINGASGVAVNRSHISGATAYGIQLNGAGANATINYTLIGASANNKAPTAGIYVGAGTAAINNCDVVGTTINSIYSAGTTTVRNTRIGSPSKVNVHAVKKDGGVLNLYNNLISAGWGTSTAGYAISGTPDVSEGNIIGSNTSITSYPRRGYIVPTVDDWANYAQWQLLQAQLDARGLKGTFAVEGMYFAANSAALNAIISAGHSIGIHGWTGARVDTTGNVFSITKAGATINVDRAADTITIDPGGTVTGFKAKTIGAIRTELTALGCTLGATAISVYAHGESMADSGGAQASPYTPQVLIDTTAATGFFKDELADSKAAAEAVLTGYTIKEFHGPGGGWSANAAIAARAAGYLNFRQSIISDTYLTSIDVYNKLSYISTTPYLADDASDANTRARTRALCEAICEHGYIYYLVSHNTDEATSEQLGIILDTIAEYPCVKIANGDTAIAEIRAAPWATADSITYTRTWSAITEDRRPKSGSPAINAGVDVGLTTDADGKPIVGLPDIGAYEYQPTASGLLMCQ